MLWVILIVAHFLGVAAFYVFTFIAPRGLHLKSEFVYHPRYCDELCRMLDSPMGEIDNSCVSWCEFSVQYQNLLKFLDIAMILSFSIFLPICTHMALKIHSQRYREWLLYCEAQTIYEREEEKRRRKRDEQRRKRERDHIQRVREKRDCEIEAIYQGLLVKKDE